MQITLRIPKSRSRNYKVAIGMGSEFNNFDGEYLKIPAREIFGRWDDFNTIFWMVVKWRGAWIEFRGMWIESPEDMKRIFYALQQAHQNWINETCHQVVNFYRVMDGSQLVKSYNDMTKAELDHYIDVQAIKEEYKPKHK